jgi:hydrogenase/urease accessory protein HupE
MMSSARFALALLLLFRLGASWPHDARPAYLEITETGSERYTVLLRTPVFSGMPLPVELRFPDEVRNIIEPSVRMLPDLVVERRLIEVPGGLAGKRIEVVGLQGTIADVLARIQMRDGRTSTTLIHPSHPWMEVRGQQGAVAVFAAYLRHGFDHILLGYDHLLFVFALILLVRNVRMLLWTVTAFTLAHSITLALATLGWVHVPSPPVEATIALSIILLAVEIVRIRRAEYSLTASRPWVVAFLFGLLHGLGFAGALSEIGLPSGDVPLALFAFNAGVEIGQLAFIAAVLGLYGLAKQIKVAAQLESVVRPAAPYVIGSVASFWFFERLAGFTT